jgi:hypothetical protein
MEMAGAAGDAAGEAAGAGGVVGLGAGAVDGAGAVVGGAAEGGCAAGEHAAAMSRRSPNAKLVRILDGVIEHNRSCPNVIGS